MQPIERQPVEVRKAYAIAELVKIVNDSKTIEEAKERCKQKLMELVDQGIVREAQEDVLEIRATIRSKIDKKFLFQLDGRSLHEQNLCRAEELKLEGDSKRESGDYEASIVLYREAQKLDSTNPIYYRNLGWSYYWMKNYELANIEFKTAILYGIRDNGATLRTFAQSLRACGNLDEALNYERRASTISISHRENQNIDSDEVDYYLNIGLNLQKNGQSSKSKIYLERSLFLIEKILSKKTSYPLTSYLVERKSVILSALNQ